MSENKGAKATDTAPAAAAAPSKPKGGALGMIIGIVVPGLLSVAGSFGGARAASHGGAAPHAEVVPAHRPEPKPPGPTVALDPFLVTVVDASRKSHPMKLTVAVEFEATAKEDAVKPFTPRIRDAILAYMRTLSYEDAVDQEHSVKLRTDLLERVHKAGAIGAERVLITDLVSQ